VRVGKLEPWCLVVPAAAEVRARKPNLQLILLTKNLYTPAKERR
jgi:hypothetical protein